MSEGQELRYAITSGVMDGSNPIYVAKDEFTDLKRTQERLISVLNQSTGDWYTHAAIFVCCSAAIFSTAAVTAGS